MFFYTSYNNSILATIISGFSCLLIFLGIYGLFTGEPDMLWCAAVGAPGVFLARWIANRKAYKTAFINWYAERDPGCDQLVRSSGEYAQKLYEAMPTGQMLRYIRTLNPEAAAQIQARSGK